MKCSTCGSSNPADFYAYLRTRCRHCYAVYRRQFRPPKTRSNNSLVSTDQPYGTHATALCWCCASFVEVSIEEVRAGLTRPCHLLHCQETDALKRATARRNIEVNRLNALRAEQGAPAL
jgi:hypothetical protein